MAGKLHEVLAVEGSAQSRAAKLVVETTSVFKNKENIFKGRQRILKLFDQDPAREIEIKSLEAKDSTTVRVESTVPDSLNYLGCILGDYWDVMYQKEATNQLANADIIVDGNVILKSVPVTFLLCMENRLKDLRPVLESIPTLAPGVAWALDDGYGRHIYRAPEASDVKTRETVTYPHVFEPTDKQPGQYVTEKTQVNIGKYTTNEWSGLISSAEKARLLENFDKIIGAVKQARQRANNIDAVTTKVSDQLIGAILGGWYDRTQQNPAVLK